MNEVIEPIVAMPFPGLRFLTDVLRQGAKRMLAEVRSADPSATEPPTRFSGRESHLEIASEIGDRRSICAYLWISEDVLHFESKAIATMPTCPYPEVSVRSRPKLECGVFAAGNDRSTSVLRTATRMCEWICP